MTLFTCFVNAWCNQWVTEKKEDLEIIDSFPLDTLNSNLKLYLKKLAKLTHWKQIQLKLIDWLITVYNFKQITIETKSNIQSKFLFVAEL